MVKPKKEKAKNKEIQEIMNNKDMLDFLLADLGYKETIDKWTKNYKCLPKPFCDIAKYAFITGFLIGSYRNKTG